MKNCNDYISDLGDEVRAYCETNGREEGWLVITELWQNYTMAVEAATVYSTLCAFAPESKAVEEEKEKALARLKRSAGDVLGITGGDLDFRDYAF